METFSYWAKIFFTQKQTEGLSTSRIRGIKNELNHLEPLNNLKLDEINLMDIQKVINELHLSKKTLQGIKWTVKAVFENAIDNRVINFNPSIKLKIPKTATVLEREPITTEQCQWIINTSHRAKCIAMIMLFAGLRRGEVIALNWSDIDFTFKTISINKSVEFIKNRPIVKPPKTKAGNRLISIPDILANYLLKEKENS
ncbi:MAG: site-specific integrase, partial [Oscillospiraceae bacterium]